MNFDGAIFDKDNNAGLGVVIRNNEGLVLASLSQLIPLPPTVIEVETLTARRALEVAAKDIHFLTHTFQLSIYPIYVGIVIRLLIHLPKKKKSNSFPPLSVWMEDILPDIISVLQADLNNLF